MTQNQRLAAPGFSFIEIVIAIFIMALVMSIGVPSYFYFVNKARISTTRGNLTLLKNSINLYQMEHGKYPTRLLDLSERPQGDAGKSWRPYIDKLPKDAWAQDFYYKILPTGGKRPYELYSYGSAEGPDTPVEDRLSAWD